MADDLTRRFRALRPPTTADEDWTNSLQAQDILGEVHRRTSRRPAVHRSRWFRTLVPVSLAAAATAVGLVLSTTPAQHSGPALGEGYQLPAVRPAAMLLSDFTSCDDLLDGLREHASKHVSSFGFRGDYLYNYGYGGPFVVHGGLSYGLAASSAPAGAGASTGALDSTPVSGTNVQEQGVDEPDIVKSDDGRIVTFTDGVLRVVDIGTHSVIGTLDLGAYAGAESGQLLVDGTHALVILDDQLSVTSMPYYYAPVRAANAHATLLFVDLTDEPQVTGSMRIEGSYLDARQVGTTVRLVASSRPDIDFPRRALKSINQDRVAHAPLDAWLPNYTITSGGHTSHATVPCQSVSHPTDYTATSMLTVYTLDLDDLGSDPEPISVAADGDTVYATATSLYVASNPSWYCCTNDDQDTELHRFDIGGDGPPTYLGSGTVPGRLLNQYSLSEWDDHLRIATQDGSASSVYVLDAATLVTTGAVHDLGSSERLYAVRFVGPMAYVVTFRNTDPLYVVDLHDPDAPKLAGSLELNGYSDYLHDAGDGRVLGVGQDATDRGRVNGLQVSLFDVTDPAAPRRTGQVVLDNAFGEDAFDPHTFLYWSATGLVVVPVPDWTGRQAGKVLVCTVSGTSLHEVGTLANPVDDGTSDDGLGIRRSLVVGDELWTVSSAGIRATDPGDLSTTAQIPFLTP